MSRTHQNSLGDILRAVSFLGVTNDAARRDIAAMLGFGSKDEIPPPEIESPAQTQSVSGAPSARQPGEVEQESKKVEDVSIPDLSGEVADDAWLEVEGSRSFRKPRWFASIKATSELADEKRGEQPDIDSLFRPEWTRTLLQNLLAVIDHSGAVDVERTIEFLSNGIPLARFPRKLKMHTGAGVEVLVDLGESMRPYAEDQAAILADIKRVVTSRMATQLFFNRIPARGVRRNNGPEMEQYKPLPGSVVLMLTDLGAGSGVTPGSHVHFSEWQQFSEQVRRTGCPLIALVPYPLKRIPLELRRLMVVVPWDRSTTTGLVRRLRVAANQK